MPATKKKTRNNRPPRPGTCWICGCTQNQACPDGCGWANKDQTLCTACTSTIAGAISTAIAALLIERTTNEAFEPRRKR